MSKKAIVDLIPVQGAAYAGSGDIVSFAAWWGLRAYSLATVGANLIRIQRASDSTQQDFSSLSSGKLDTGSIATFLTATSGVIVTFYDQVSTKNLVTSGFTNPSYVPNNLGTLPTSHFTAANGAQAASPGATFTTPFTGSFVGRRTSGTGFISTLDVNVVRIGYASSANQIMIYAGIVGTATASDAAVHAIIGIVNGASSIAFVDNTKTTGISASSNTVTNEFYSIRVHNQSADMDFYEGGWMTGAISDANAASLTTNQKTYWGF